MKQIQTNSYIHDEHANIMRIRSIFISIGFALEAPNVGGAFKCPVATCPDAIYGCRILGCQRHTGMSNVRMRIVSDQPFRSKIFRYLAWMRSSRVWMRSSLERMRSSRVWMSSSLVRMRSIPSGVDEIYSRLWMRSSRERMRSS